jgi:hypothetical protein
MTAIPQKDFTESPTAKAIFANWKKKGDSEPYRGYLGASIIGHECERHLWYTFRDCSKEDFPGRLYRLFDHGDLEEVRIVKDLREIGCEIHEVDPETGKQFEVNSLGGHFSGHMDGCVRGLPEAPKTWHVWEGKTHNDKSFKKLLKDGILESKPKHYAQMQVYMHLTGMKRALYTATNKNDDVIYAERVYYDKDYALNLMAKAERIITSPHAPARLSEREDWYQCRYCPSRHLCHGIGPGSKVPVIGLSCRQCVHATAAMDGDARWVCDKHKRGLCEKDQITCCDDHLFLPDIVGIDPAGHGETEAGKEYVVYTQDDGVVFRNGGGGFSSRELAGLTDLAMESKCVAVAKNLFGAEIGGVQEDLLAMYPEEDSELLWEGETFMQLVDFWKKRFGTMIDNAVPRRKSDMFDYLALEYNMGYGVLVIGWRAKDTENVVRYEVRKGKE